MMKAQIVILFTVATVLQTVLAQQQSSETCAALNWLIANRNVNGIGNCTSNNLCTSITCTIEDPGVRILNVLVTFLPCEDPISVHHRTAITHIGAEVNTTVIDQISNENQNISFPPPSPFGASVILSQTNTGVNYGLVQTSKVETTPLFQQIDIPLQCSNPIPQQSSETCAALDTLIAGRYVNETGICAKNSLCTAITCVNPDWGEAINLMVTFSPCDDPISVSIWAVVTPAGAQPTAMDQISTENRAISFPAPFSNLGVYIMLDQTDTGVNFGLNGTTTDERGTVETVALFQPTDIPFQCPIGGTDAGSRIQAGMATIFTAPFLCTVLLIKSF